MRNVWTVSGEIDLALIESLLAAAEIPYVMSNEHFGALLVGPSIPLYNARAVVVDDADAAEAQRLISDYLVQRSPERVGGKQRARTLLEFLLISGWFFPWRGPLRVRRAMVAALALTALSGSLLLGGVLGVGVVSRWWSGLNSGRQPLPSPIVGSWRAGSPASGSGDELAAFRARPTPGIEAQGMNVGTAR